MAILMVSLLVALSAVRARAEAQCLEDAGSIHFTVTSLRNSTGHRTIAAQLMHLFPGVGGRRENGTNLDVRQSSGRCGDLHFLRLVTSAVTSTGLTELPLLAVPAGYELFPGAGRYKLYTARQSWSNAQETCQADGANLVVINSETEAEVIRKFYARKNPALTNVGLWSGFHALFRPGHFVTVFGETLSKTGYDKWGANEPLAGKFCGYTYQDGLIYMWDCGGVIPFLCELQS